VTESSSPTSYDLNRASWDERAPAHAASPDYAFDRFVADPEHLSDVVRFDLPRLGDVSGLRGVHLQCHIGTDTVSLSRLGARMTGLDFSPASLAEARRLVASSGDDVDFVEAPVYEALDVLEPGSFDFVFTGIGALCWLPDIRQWAQVVADLLRPGGRLFIREGHPVLWAIDEAHTDSLVIDYPYFERPEPLPWEDASTYVETDAVFTVNLTHSWNHGLGEIFTALIDCGLAISAFEEHDSIPWDGLPGQLEKIAGGEYRLVDRPWRMPMSYTLQAVKA
jgi:SAM-dependent methyltransferase